MARSTAEIQADITVTRRQVEGQLDALRTRVPDGRWVPYAVLAGALATGALLSFVPLTKAVGTGTRLVKAGMAVASAFAAVDRFIAQRPDRARLPERRKAA